MYVIPLNEIRPEDGPRTGGKAAGLARLIAAGFDVPGGFCITTDACREHLRAGVAASEPPGPEAAVRCITGSEMPAPVKERILAAYREMAGGRSRAVPVAVRSSAEAEDLPGASFAGQYDTVLNVDTPDGLLAAVRRCWASGWSDRAVAYRRQAGLDPALTGMAVVVQEMVPAEVSGVAFTINPVSGDASEMLVNAHRGLGEALVSGRVTPEEFVLARPGGKMKRVRRALDSAGRTGRPCLGPRRLKKLARLSLAIERHFGAPQDIEWALRRGRFRVLQARPVTAARKRSLPFPVIWGNPVNGEIAPGRVVFWCNWNTRENMPYPLKPLAWSFFNDVLVPPITEALWGIDERSPLYRHSFVIDLVDGRAYWNMNLLFGHPFLGRLTPAMLRMLDPATGEIFDRLRVSGEFEPVRPPVRWTALVRPFVRALLTIVRFPWLAGPRRIQARCDDYWKLAEGYEALRLGDKPIDELIAQIRRFSELTVRRIFPVLAVSLKFMVGLGLVRRLTRRMKDVEVGDLLVGIPGNKTTEGALELFELSQMTAGVRRVFLETDLPDLERTLAGSEEGKAFLGRVETFLDRHVFAPVWDEAKISGLG